MITIYGASDDLIEIEGDIKEEFGHYRNDGEPALLAFSDGTLLQIAYGTNGQPFWRITPLVYGNAKYSKIEATNDETDYSDKVTLEGEINWVVYGSAFSKSQVRSN